MKKNYLSYIRCKMDNKIKEKFIKHYYNIIHIFVIINSIIFIFILANKLFFKSIKYDILLFLVSFIDIETKIIFHLTKIEAFTS